MDTITLMTPFQMVVTFFAFIPVVMILWNIAKILWLATQRSPKHK